MVCPDQLLAGELVRRWASRSASRRLLTKMIVEWWLRTSSRIRGWIAGQMLHACLRTGRRTTGLLLEWQRFAEATEVLHGHDDLSSSGLRVPASTIATGRPSPTPPRKRAIVSSGRCVADSPMRCGIGSHPRDEPLQALHAQREVCAALASRDRVDLVHDHVSTVVRISRAWLVSSR